MISTLRPRSDSDFNTSNTTDDQEWIITFYTLNMTHTLMNIKTYHAFSEVRLGELPDNLTLHQDVLCQLWAILRDLSNNVLYVLVRVDFLGDASVDADQGHHRQQCSIIAVLVCLHSLGEQGGALLDLLINAWVSGGLRVLDHVVECLHDRIWQVARTFVYLLVGGLRWLHFNNFKKWS